MNVKGAVNVTSLCDTPQALKIPVQTVAVRIGPQAALSAFLPRKSAQHLTTIRKEVEGKLTFESRITVKDNQNIIYRTFYSAVLITLELFSPVQSLSAGVCRRGIVLSRDTFKVLDGGLMLLTVKRCDNCLITDGKSAHFSVRGKL